MAVENITGNESIEELQRLTEVFNKRIRLLDEKKAATKPEIFQKVRGEYEAKLLELQVLLEEKGAGMQEALDAALAEQAGLLAREKEIRTEMEELELRAAIGEVEDADYARKSEAHNSETEAIVAKLQELTEKIDNYQALVGGKTAQPAAPVASLPPAAPPPPRVIAPKPASPPPPAAPAPEPAPPPAPEPEAQPAPAVQRSELDDLEKQFASILGANFGQEQPAAEPTAPLPEPIQIEENLSFQPKAEDAPVEDSHEGELTCPKCGAFNRADNWYCEKCGNELINATDLLGGK
ncbi:MAG: zinc finger Ran-binding domain-containing protein [Candidatus Edwardsbacteria bacterium]|nr:zinc finger Ran-binding domain-containing protein [Candidatus Edwardsbacteria bacterium]